MVGGLGTIAGLIAGYATAHQLYYVPPPDPQPIYPFIPPVAAIAFAERRPRFGVVGIIASTVAAFLLMFALTAAAYSSGDHSVIMYGAWCRDG